MTIGDRIRAYRKEKAFTQSDLAELVGVSTQAISKWETNGGMPDISQIVPLSRALGTSTDELLGNQNKRREYEKQWLEALRQYGEGSEEMLEFVNRALNEFPDDETFLYRRMCDEYFLSQKSADYTQTERYLSLAKSHALYLVEHHRDFDSAVGMLVNILTASDMRDEAIAWAYKSKDKDRLLKSCLTGEELRRHRQKLIDKKLRDLIGEMTCCDLTLLDTAKAFVYTAIPDGNFLYFTDSLMMIEKCRAEFYIKSNEYDKAIACLRDAFKIAETDIREPGEHRFTAPIFDFLSYKRNANRPSLAEQLIFILENDIFDILKHHPDYQTLIKDINEYTAYCIEKDSK